MPVSEAKIRANQQNSLRSTGPKSVAGKERSRQNGLKHGLTGDGVVVAPEDSAEVARRNEALQAELAPKSSLGQILIVQMATLSVRMERGAQQEFASVAARVRHASDDFDAERLQEAEALFATLKDDPRKVARTLRKSPEGIDLLIEAWGELRRELTRISCPRWNDASLAQAASLLGLRSYELTGSRLDTLARATWGQFGGLSESERTGLEVDALKAWAKARLIESIDAEIAGLEAHRESLDLATIEQDRAEAGDRALFDPSREASLARRYESEARRGFFKALDQFRKVEAEAAAREETVAAESPEARELASSRESERTPVREPRPATPQAARPARADEMVVASPRNRSEAAGRMVSRAG